MAAFRDAAGRAPRLSLMARPAAVLWSSSLWQRPRGGAVVESAGGKGPGPDGLVGMERLAEIDDKPLSIGCMNNSTKIPTTESAESAAGKNG